MLRNCEVRSCIRTHQNDASAFADVLVSFSGHEKLTTGVDAEDAVELALENQSVAFPNSFYRDTRRKCAFAHELDSVPL